MCCAAALGFNMEKSLWVKVVFVYVLFASLELSFDNPFLAVFEAFPRYPYCNHYWVDLTVLLQSLLGRSLLYYDHRKTQNGDVGVNTPR